jgi:hypothetical protein
MTKPTETKPAEEAKTDPAPPPPPPPYVAPLRDRYLGLEPLLDAPVRAPKRRR